MDSQLDMWPTEHITADEALIRLRTLQGDGQAMRNALLEASVIFKDTAEKQYAAVISKQIQRGDAWVRDVSTPAAESLRGQVSAAALVQLKTELWHELRRELAGSIREVADALATGEDLGSARVRLPRSMG